MVAATIVSTFLLAGAVGWVGMQASAASKTKINTNCLFFMGRSFRWCSSRFQSVPLFWNVAAAVFVRGADVLFEGVRVTQAGGMDDRPQLTNYQCSA